MLETLMIFEMYLKPRLDLLNYDPNSPWIHHNPPRTEKKTSQTTSLIWKLAEVLRLLADVRSSTFDVLNMTVASTKTFRLCQEVSPASSISTTLTSRCLSTTNMGKRRIWRLQELYLLADLFLDQCYSTQRLACVAKVHSWKTRKQS